jgi:hypothetical protein
MEGRYIGPAIHIYELLGVPIFLLSDFHEIVKKPLWGVAKSGLCTPHGEIFLQVLVNVGRQGFLDCLSPSL